MMNKLLVSFLIFIISFLIFSKDLDKPFWGEHDWNGVRYGNIARNYLRYGLFETKLGQVENSGFVQKEEFEFLTHYPPMLPLLIALSYKVFGVSEWSTRLIPVIFSAGIVVLIFLVGSYLKSIRVGIIASLLALVTPLVLYFGKNPVHEPLVVFFVILAFFGFLNKNKYLFIFGLITAQLTTWAGHFLVPAIILVAILRRDKNLVMSTLPYLIISVIILFIHLIYTHTLTGSIIGGDLLGTYLQRSGVSQTVQPEGFGIISYILRLRIWFFTLYTATLMVLVSVWLISKKFSSWVENDWYLLTLGFFGLTYLVLFPNAGYIHNYLVFYMLPFFVLAASSAIVFLMDLKIVTKFKLLLPIALIFLVFIERKNFLEALNKSDADRTAVIIGKQINLQSSEKDQVLIIPEKTSYSWGNFLKFYSDRRLIFSNDRDKDADLIINIKDQQFEIIKSKTN